LELPGIRRPITLVALAAVAVVFACVPAAATAGTAATAATAATKSAATKSASTATDPNTPVLVTDQNTRPKGYRLTAAKVERIAARNPTVVGELHRHPRAQAYEYTKGPGRWQVSWFSSGKHAVELAQVYVDDASGRVTEAWTGFQVAWSMARGYSGAFGRRVNALYVWIPLCVLFVAPFLPWPRLRRRSRAWTGPRWSLLHLDLLVLLSFSVSLALFNHGTIGLSTPLIYPPLLYLLARMLLLAFGRGRPRRPLRLAVPVAWLAVGVLFLVGFRVGLNVTNSNVIDVGYSGVVGADKLVHGQHLYGHWPKDNAFGDTYGPVAYYAYVPFRAIFGWSGTWDDLPAAHAAAIAFDLLTIFGLFLLGRRIRGPTLGVVLAYAWAAFPFTLWTLSSNTNDSLVSMLLVFALLAIRSSAGRGVLAALAGLTKFVPLLLAPLFLRGRGSSWPRPRAIAIYVLAYGLTIAVAMLPVLLHDNLRAFWHDSVVYQANRVSPFSVWGLWGGLSLEQHLVQGAAIGLAILVAFVPRRRGVVEVAALAAAVVIAIQLSASYWLYSYIVWFFPLVAIALFGSFPSREPETLSELRVPAPAPARSPSPALTPQL
jgi:hypothetical protein